MRGKEKGAGRRLSRTGDGARMPTFRGRKCDISNLTELSRRKLKYHSGGRASLPGTTEKLLILNRLMRREVLPGGESAEGRRTDRAAGFCMTPRGTGEMRGGAMGSSRVKGARASCDEPPGRTLRGAPVRARDSGGRSRVR